LSLVLIKKEFGIWFEWQRVEIVKFHLVDGWHVFLASFGISLYKNNAIIILGLFTSPLIVGYFSIAKKVIDALNQIASIVSRVILPYINNRLQSNKELLLFLKRILIIIIIYTLLLFFLIVVFATNISLLLSGNILKELIYSLNIMAIVPFIIAVNIPAVHILLKNKQDKYFSRTVLFGGIFDLILLLILIPSYSYIGASISVLLTEIFVTIRLYYYAIKTIKGNI